MALCDAVEGIRKRKFSTHVPSMYSSSGGKSSKVDDPIKNRGLRNSMSGICHPFTYASSTFDDLPPEDEYILGTCVLNLRFRMPSDFVVRNLLP